MEECKICLGTGDVLGEPCICTYSGTNKDEHNEDKDIFDE